MRTIKFRGKRIDNGKWAIGDLQHHNDGSVTIMTNLSVWSDNDGDVDAYGEELRVVPETVGQYTGMKDCNSQDIYDGDIIRDLRGVREVQFVIFDNRQGYEIELEDSDLEVIGNIHDTPELLKGGQNV